jgi:hypothetical protein
LSDDSLYADPAQIEFQFLNSLNPDDKRDFGTRRSGTILEGDWDKQTKAIAETRKYKACFQRFEQGKSWAETGLFGYLERRIAQYGVFDNCRSLKDIVVRYDAIDRMYDQLAMKREILPQDVLPGYFRKEYGGIYCHIDRAGDPIRYHNGNHRFAIAKILKIPEIPFHVGVVHVDAIRQGY